MSLCLNKVCILVHGTWGNESEWHSPNDPFYKTLKSELDAENIKLIKLIWSGALSYEKRLIAGTELANLINSYSVQTKFILITHSHGGNIGIIASQQLKDKSKIERFYALGTPIDNISYLPNMHVIKNFYNIFSFGDIYQTALGMHERVLPFTPGIYNINIEINDKRPGHEELHCKTIAKWLLQIDSPLQELHYNNHFFAKFYDTCKPHITIDTNFKNKLAQDLKLHAKICYALPSGQPDWRNKIIPIDESLQIADPKYH